MPDCSLRRGMGASLMTSEQWTAVDDYLVSKLVKPDEALDAALLASAQADLPAISVSACQGKFLHLLARMQGSRRILEVGTLGGYSTIWLARALPAGGKLVTLEVDPKHAEVAKSNFVGAGVSDRIELRLGSARESMPQLIAEKAGPFDLIFIDADKESIPDYFQWALRLSHQGSVIVIDNVIREGAVIEADSKDPRVKGVRRLNELLAAEPRVTATTIQTVGSKGHDGFTLVLVTADP